MAKIAAVCSCTSFDYAAAVTCKFNNNPGCYEVPWVSCFLKGKSAAMSCFFFYLLHAGKKSAAMNGIFLIVLLGKSEFSAIIFLSRARGNEFYNIHQKILRKQEKRQLIEVKSAMLSTFWRC